MNSPQRPFRTNIGFIVNQPVGFSRDFPFEFDSVVLDGDFDVQNLTGTITLTRTSGGVQAQGDFSAGIEGDCGRCLKAIDLKLTTEFDQLYSFDAESMTEDEELIPHDGYLDFENLIRDYLMMEFPRKPLCEPDCRGLCVVCGQDLNEALCEHESHALDQSTVEPGEDKKYPHKTKTNS